MYKCTNPDCGLEDGMSCDKGHFDLKDCKFITKTEEVNGQLIDDPSSSTYKVFWSGIHLGFKGL